MSRAKLSDAAMGMIFVVMAWGLPASVSAQGGQGGSPPPARPAESSVTASRPSTAPPVVYKPPLRGAPADRIGGGTRAFGPEELPQVVVLAPDHMGLTTQPRPNLYWYISRPTSLRIDFSLREEQTGGTILETTLPPPQTVGIQRIALSELGVELAASKDYRWIVTVVVDPQRRSRDVFSAGMIRRVDGPRLPTDRIQGGDKLLTAAWYAGEGLWYDALEAIGQAVEAEPGDRTLRTVRATLLDQVGLCQPARHEMSQ